MAQREHLGRLLAVTCPMNVAVVFRTSRMGMVLCNIFVCKPESFMELFGAHIRKVFPQTPSVTLAFGAQYYPGSE